MIIRFQNFAINSFKNNENAAILKIIEMSEKMFTPDSQQSTLTSFYAIQFKEGVIEFYVHRFKDLKD